MNDNELMNENSRVDTYRATTNLNTAIENPQINMNSAMGVNIKNVESNHLDTTNFSNDTLSNPQFDNYNSYNNYNNSLDFSQNAGYDTKSQFQEPINSGNIPTTTTDSVQYPQNSNYMVGDNQFIPTGVSNEETEFVPTDTGSVVYEPTLEEKKRPSGGITVSRELKIMLFIVFILFIFILLMPYIYDFFRNLQLVITNG